MNVSKNGLSDIALFLEPVDIDRYDFIRLGVKERWAVTAACRRSAGAKGLCYGGRSGGEGAAFSRTAESAK